MDVQLGIETEDDRHLVDYIYADDQERIAHLLVERLQQSGFKIAPREGTPAGEELEADTLGRFILDAVTGSTPFGTSVWWRPDRRQINDLIRLLRRARDAAFGRDE